MNSGFLVLPIFFLVVVGGFGISLPSNHRVFDGLDYDFRDNQLQQIVSSNFPFFRSSCASLALSELLPLCLQHGLETVPSLLRVKTAIKLSMCEFEASGLKSIPQNCDRFDGSTIENCVRELETLPQWWTTYSGNFQRLSSLCYENSLPYEKEQILELFLNITRAYEDMQAVFDRNVREAYSSFEDLSAENDERFEQFFEEQYERFENMTKAHGSATSSQVAHFQEELSERLSNSLSHTNAFVDELGSDVFDGLQLIRKLFREFYADLNDSSYSRQIQDLKDEHLSNLEALSRDSVHVAASQKEDMKKFEKMMTEVQSHAILELNKMDQQLEIAFSDAVTFLQGFDGVVRNLVLPSIQEELIPQVHKLSMQVNKALTMTDTLIEGKMRALNQNLDETLGQINSNLNSTLTTINEIDSDINILKQDFFAIMILIHSLKRVFWVFGRLFVSSVTNWKVASSLLTVFYTAWRLVAPRIMLRNMPLASGVLLFIRNVLLLIFTPLFGAILGQYLVMTVTNENEKAN
ncbi:LAMI_0E00914g1_1 [Lachancea mirantina]|uniref:Nuclear fusion protein KAR5 n=1 Tax=Lachancea mirantina TaxID=1230905 RepID=A0A1G4JJ45_9SACH|nr:LAMI_0E00914g1_1 [Lachancea mirantina]